jgi:peptidyl-prolyl cis-trans isomerase-like 4
MKNPTRNECIFSSFGPIVKCEIIRDRTTGESLQYAFIEFETKEACEAAWKKMQITVIDDCRIHVDFSQSVGDKWKNYKKGGGARAKPY